MSDHSWFQTGPDWKWCRTCGLLSDGDVTYLRPGADGHSTSTDPGCKERKPPCRLLVDPSLPPGEARLVSTVDAVAIKNVGVEEAAEKLRTTPVTSVVEGDAIYRLRHVDSLNRVRKYVETPTTVDEMATRQLTTRQELMDLLALKYDQSWHLVERRDGLKTTWAIEPRCLGCGERDEDDHCFHPRLERVRAIDMALGTPGWCPRRRDG